MEARAAAFGIKMERIYAVVRLPPARLRLELHTIVFSHYNDKARWALEAARVAYTEVAHASLFHALAVRRLLAEFGVRGRRDGTSSALSTPVLAIYDAATAAPLLLLPDSSLIARFASAYGQRHAGAASLYKVGGGGRKVYTGGDSDADLAALFEEDAGVAALEKRFHDVLGVSSRVVAYYELLPSPRLFATLDWRNRAAVGLLATLAHILAYPFIALAIWFAFGISAASFERHRGRLDAEFDFVEALAGEADAAPDLRAAMALPPPAGADTAVNAAHITFAALASVALAVSSAEGYGAELVDVASLAPLTRGWGTAAPARPAGRAILRLYRDSRLPLRSGRVSPFTAPHGYSPLPPTGTT